MNLLRPFLILPALYCLWALYLLGVVVFHGVGDGGPWIFLYFSYWPASELTLWLEDMLKLHIAAGTLHEGPFASMSWLDLFDAASALILGTAWYGFLGYLWDRFARWIGRD